MSFRVLFLWINGPAHESEILAHTVNEKMPLTNTCADTFNGIQDSTNWNFGLNLIKAIWHSKFERWNEIAIRDSKIKC